MSNEELRKTLELLGEASNEINPIFAKGEELELFWDSPALGELYRYLEGKAQ